MNRAMIVKFGMSALLLGTVAVGCKPAGHPAALSDSTLQAARQAGRRAAQATSAMTRGKPVVAVRFAEEAVALAPQTAGYRVLLGRAYIAAGRFNSADTALTDALALSPDDGQALLSLALTRIALGNDDTAPALLAQAAGKVGESDRGLALSLAGDTNGGVAILERAARAEGADAKARQNYALGLALAGRWAESRSVAAQDLSGDQLKGRMTEWARFSRPRYASDQVAALLRVTPAEDGGMPATLALATPAVSGQALASNGPDQPVLASTTDASQVVEAAAMANSAVIAPMVAMAATPPKLIERAAASPRAVSVAQAGAPSLLRQTARGRYVVQIGAYSTVAKVEQAWRETARRIDHIADLTPYSAAYGTPQGRMYRLSLGGIESHATAATLCRRIRAANGACFVRTQAGDALASWVAKPVRLATG